MGDAGRRTATTVPSARFGKTAKNRGENCLLARSRRLEPLAQLTPKEREVLSLMAEGRSNAAIAETLVVTLGGVEKHVASIFMKLDLPADDDQRHRRVAAVVQYLGS